MQGTDRHGDETDGKELRNCFEHSEECSQCRAERTACVALDDAGQGLGAFNMFLKAVKSF